MATDMPRPTSFDISNGQWARCEVAFRFINGSVREALVGPDGRPSPIPLALVGGWHRSLAWQYTVTRLTAPADFQAVFAACRALLEIVVDCVLLHHLPDAAAKAADWELSAKLKHAEAIRRHYGGKGNPPSEMRHAMEFAAREGTRINGIRAARRWIQPSTGKARHPDRWTAQDLGHDARSADRFEHGLRLEEIYETKYRMMCWYVHGSGAIGLNALGADLFPGLGTLVFPVVATLAVEHAKLLLKYSNLWDVPHGGESWSERFQRLAREEALASYATTFGSDAAAVALAAASSESGDE